MLFQIIQRSSDTGISADVALEFAGNNLARFTGFLPAEAGEVLEDGIGVKIADSPCQSSQNQLFRVESVDEKSESLGVAQRHLIPESQSVGIVGTDRFFKNNHVDFLNFAVDQLHNHGVGLVPELLLHTQGKVSAAAVGFVAAPLAAAAGTAVKLQADMAQLTGAQSLAAPDQIVGADHAAADTGAHGEVNEVPAVPSGAEEPLGKGAAVGVIFKTAGNVELALQIAQNQMFSGYL